MSYKIGRRKEYYVLYQLRKLFPYAKRVPLSGALRGDKGDILIKDVIIEVKGRMVYPRERDRIFKKAHAIVFKNKNDRWTIMNRRQEIYSLGNFIAKFNEETAYEWLKRSE